MGRWKYGWACTPWNHHHYPCAGGGEREGGRNEGKIGRRGRRGRKGEEERKGRGIKRRNEYKFTKVETREKDSKERNRDRERKRERESTRERERERERKERKKERKKERGHLRDEFLYSAKLVPAKALALLFPRT